MNFIIPAALALMVGYFLGRLDSHRLLKNAKGAMIDAQKNINWAHEHLESAKQLMQAMEKFNINLARQNELWMKLAYPEPSPTPTEPKDGK